MSIMSALGLKKSLQGSKVELTISFSGGEAPVVRNVAGQPAQTILFVWRRDCVDEHDLVSLCEQLATFGAVKPVTDGVRHMVVHVESPMSSLTDRSYPVQRVGAIVDAFTLAYGWKT